MKYLPKGSKLEIIKDADHDLRVKHGIVPILSSWFRENLK
jgi:hypothetical protein